MELVEPCSDPSQTCVGSVFFALTVRTVQHTFPAPATGGLVVTALLRHIYLKEPLSQCLDDCQHHLDTEEQRNFAAVIKVALKLLRTIDVSADSLESQRQVVEHLGQVLLQQADCSACGMPAATLAYCLMAMIEKVPEAVAATADDGGYDFLAQQAVLLTPAFKRTSAGKAFGQCPIHKNKECGHSAQSLFSMVFFTLAEHSYATQLSLWCDGGILAGLLTGHACIHDVDRIIYLHCIYAAK